MNAAIWHTFWWVSFMWVAGCVTNTSDTVPYNGNPAGTIPVVAGADTGAACPANNLTQPCLCSLSGTAVAGRQTCNVSSGWGQCDCANVIATGGLAAGGSVSLLANKSNTTFSWSETKPGNRICLAGHYKGVFNGAYVSPFLSNLLDPIPIGLTGNVEFDVFQIGSGEYFEIRDGLMIGCAMGNFPFTGEIKGTLDCSGDKASFDGFLKKGVYSVIGINYVFDGRAAGSYDKATTRFFDGEWGVVEPVNYDTITLQDGSYDLGAAEWGPMPEVTAGVAPQLELFVNGGVGQWSAEWVGPATGVNPSTGGDGCSLPGAADAGSLLPF